MKATIVTAVTAAVIGLLVGTQANGPREETDTAGVRAVLEAQAAAWNRGDLDGFMAGYWEDEGLTFYSSGGVRKGYKELKERYRQKYQAGGKEKDMGRLTFSDLEVQGMGEGWATARGRWAVEKGGKKAGGLFTLVLRRMAGGWKIVQDHTSEDKKD